MFLQIFNKYFTEHKITLNWERIPIYLSCSSEFKLNPIKFKVWRIFCRVNLCKAIWETEVLSLRRNEDFANGVVKTKIKKCSTKKQTKSFFVYVFFFDMPVFSICDLY